MLTKIQTESARRVPTRYIPDADDRDKRTGLAQLRQSIRRQLTRMQGEDDQGESHGGGGEESCKAAISVSVPNVGDMLRRHSRAIIAADVLDRAAPRGMARGAAAAAAPSAVLPKASFGFGTELPAR